MILSGIVCSGMGYLIAETFYKLHIFSKTGDVKSELKFLSIEFVKGIIVFMLSMAINIGIELVDILYVGFMFLIIILIIIVCGTSWCVKNLNERLEERRNNK